MDDKDKEQDEQIKMFGDKLNIFGKVVRELSSSVADHGVKLDDQGRKLDTLNDLLPKHMKREEKLSLQRTISSWISTASLVLGLLTFFFYFNDKIIGVMNTVSNQSQQISEVRKDFEYLPLKINDYLHKEWNIKIPKEGE